MAAAHSGGASGGGTLAGRGTATAVGRVANVAVARAKLGDWFRWSGKELQR